MQFPKQLAIIKIPGHFKPDPVETKESQVADVCMLSLFVHVQLFATLWAVAHQAPLSMGFSRQEY